MKSQFAARPRDQTQAKKIRRSAGGGISSPSEDRYEHLDRTSSSDSGEEVGEGSWRCCSRAEQAKTNYDAWTAPTATKTIWPVPEQGSERSCVEEASQKIGCSESTMNYWRQCSGMHTVQKWCQNYDEHPGGWGALLMIHGIPEVTGRLRSKVDNFAIYSALFLSVSLSVVFDAPDAIVGRSSEDWWCDVRKRVFFCILAISVISHLLCILLAMSFANALNEAARDSDVFRMFARGQGFAATEKCQFAFLGGALLNFVDMCILIHVYTGWEVIVTMMLALVGAGKIYWDSSSLLFANGSIMKYWRSNTGGQPDEDDPYDLSVPLEQLNMKAQDGRDLGSNRNTGRGMVPKGMESQDTPAPQRDHSWQWTQQPLHVADGEMMSPRVIMHHQSDHHYKHYQSGHGSPHAMLKAGLF